MPGDALLSHLRRWKRASRRSAAARMAFWGFALGAPLCVVLVLHARMTGASYGAALDRFVRSWAALLALIAACATVALARRGPSWAALAAGLDRRQRNEGLFSAAAFLLTGASAPPALGEVVLARADSAVARLPNPTNMLFRIGWKRTVFFLALGLLMALMPGGPRGSFTGIGGGAEGSSSPEAGPESRGAPANPAADSRNTRQVPLDEMVTLALKSDRQIYPLQGEIHLTVEMKTLRPVASDVPLEVVLAVSDGLPSPDAGFGDGFRPVPLRLGWSVPKEEGASLRQRFPMKETLEALGIYRPGLFTARVFARPIDDAGAVSEGVGSNEITFQVVENKEDLQTKMPQPQGQAKQPEKQTPNKEQKGDNQGRQHGQDKPKLGDPDRLAGAKRFTSLVQPIVNAGPTVDKEVSVFEREPGGPAAPLPVARKPFDDKAARTFLRRPEVPVVPPDLTVEERDVLRRYFDSIRAQKRL